MSSADHVSISVLGPFSVDGDAVSLGPRDRVVLAALALRPGEVVERRAAGRRAVGRRRRRRRGTRSCRAASCGCARCSARHAIETSPRATGWRRRRTRSTPTASSGWLGAAWSCSPWASYDRAAYMIARRWRCGGAAAARPRGLGRRAGSRPAGSRSCASTPRSSASTPPCVPASTGRCWPRRRRGSPRRRCASGGGRCWRWRSTRPAGRPTRCAPCTRPAGCSPTELGVDPGPELVALEQAILRQDPSLVAAAALPEPSAVCPYLGLVPYDVADSESFFGREARGRRLPATPGRGRRARRWSARPAAGSRRWCGPGSPPRCGATAGGSWSSRRARTRWTRSTGRCRRRGRRRCSSSTSARRR